MIWPHLGHTCYLHLLLVTEARAVTQANDTLRLRLWAESEER